MGKSVGGPHRDVGDAELGPDVLVQQAVDDQ
jgi:hypothetical protein